MKINFQSLLLGVCLWGLTAALPPAARAADVGTGASFKGPIGLQLYSLREQFGKDVPGTLAKVQSWGVKYVELAGTYGLTPEKFKAQLDAHGLVAVSGHFSFDLYRDHPDQVVREAKALGLKYAGCAWIPHSDPFDEKTCRAAVEVFNKAGAMLAKEGIDLFYHVHGYEFQPHGDGTLLDVLINGTDPKSMHFQMDIFWIVHPGQDPVKVLAKYPGRWELMHLKDMKASTPTGLLTGHTDVSNDAALGEGKINLPAILKAGKAQGIKFYFIEDESPVSEQQVPRSLKYLSEVMWK